MSILNGPSLSERLKREQSTLDEIFGQGCYEVQGDTPDAATIQSKMLEWRLGYDARDGSVSSTLIAYPDEPWSGSAMSDLWAQFIDAEIPRLPRSASGKVELSVDEQLVRELEWLRRLSLEIFADSSKAKDATFFVRGYQRAYTDYYSGAWTRAKLMSAMGRNRR